MTMPNAGTSLMLREIGEAGEVVARMLAANAQATMQFAQQVRGLDPSVVVTIARGSSDYCALYLKYLIEIELGIPCASIGPSIASLYKAPLRLDGALAVSISQSGRSPDIVAMQEAAKRAEALTLALVNDVSSPLATDADCLLPLHAGPEKSVAATKSMIAGLVAGASLVAAWREDDALASGLIGLSGAAFRANCAAASGDGRTRRRGKVGFRARPRRHARHRRRGRAETERDLRDPRRGVLFGGSHAWSRGDRRARFSGDRFHAAGRGARRDDCGAGATS